MQEFEDFRTRLNHTNSRLEKKKVIEGATVFQKKVLLYTYHPFWTYGVSLEKAKERRAKGKALPLFELLEQLKSRTLSGHQAQVEVHKWYLENGPLIGLILNKDIECGIGPETILDVLPGLFPSFSVSLGYPKEDLFDFSEKWYASRKMDGVRCVMIKDGAEVRCLSRKGMPIESVPHLVSSVKKHPKPSFVLDGELALLREDGIEDFQGCVSAVRRKNFVAESVVYKLFDFIPLGVFLEGGGRGPVFSDRQVLLKKHICELSPAFQRIKQIPVFSEEQIDRMMKKAMRLGWEGWIVRKDDVYKGGRSKDIIKVKSMIEEEYKIIGTELGLIYPPGCHGLCKKRQVLKNVTVLHKGNEVKVGSGWKWEERVAFAKNPDKLIGQVITVQYQGESKTSKGFSLRFPIMKVLHGKKRVL